MTHFSLRILTILMVGCDSVDLPDEWADHVRDQTCAIECPNGTCIEGICTPRCKINTDCDSGCCLPAKAGPSGWFCAPVGIDYDDCQ
jgi:hypothetical protein